MKLLEADAVKEALRNRINENIDECINNVPPVDVLDKITVEIEQVAEEESKFNIKGARGLKHALKIINKYKTRMEGKDEE